MAMIGYARVSTSDQNPEGQTARLRERGCTRVFTDHGVTGKLATRPQWDACPAFVRDGDVLVVTRLDRIGRSVGNLVSVAADLHGCGVELVVLDQAIDTATPAGRMLFHVLAASLPGARPVGSLARIGRPAPALPVAPGRVV
jgi:DNA invertase Pin-like site-specific DNA recombinase